MTRGDRLLTDVFELSGHRRDRLIYLVHPDFAVATEICRDLIFWGFQVSMLPDLAVVTRLIAIRRPDLVVAPLAATSNELLDMIRLSHLGVRVFLLAPDRLRAQSVVAAFRRGASEVFSPPYSAAAIAAATVAALGTATERVSVDHGQSPLVPAPGLAGLTFREHQVLQLVVAGRSNKQIAAEFGLSPRTVEVHRRHVRVKLGARNTAELVRLTLER